MVGVTTMAAVDERNEEIDQTIYAWSARTWRRSVERVEELVGASAAQTD